jgi:hypothetical protein
MTNMDLLAFLLVGALLGAAGLLLGFAGAGYSGADFFGGLLKRAP